MPLIEPLLIEYDAITLATTALITTQQLEEDAREYEYDSLLLFDQAKVQPERDLQVRESSFKRSPSRNLLHPLELQRQVELTIHLVQPTPLTPIHNTIVEAALDPGLGLIRTLVKK
jgi:hypothetical protein